MPTPPESNTGFPGKQCLWRSLAVALGLASLMMLTLLLAGRLSASTAVAAAPGSSPALVTATPTQACGLQWQLTENPHPGSGSGLAGVAAISTNDAWAAGYYLSGGVSHTLVEHWDGSNWTAVTSPNVGADDNGLSGISAASTNDVWAVGAYIDATSGLNRTLIEHWDGSVWSVVNSPNSGAGYNNLGGVVALSSTDVWAAGLFCTGSCQYSSYVQTLIMHWGGSAWTIVPSPNLSGENNYLAAISGNAADNLWAVGQYNACYGCVALTLVLHWDGTQWSIVTSPNAGSSTNYLYGVSVLSNNDAWAVGHYYTPGDARWRTLTLHWDGTAWSVVSSPNAGQGNNFLYGVVAIAANDVWAVGTWGASSALTLHWDGTTWGLAASPNAGSGTNNLNGVSATASNDVWAVGYNSISGQQTLIQRYSDICPPPTYTATATNTPTITPTPTVTDTPTEVCGLRWRAQESQDPGTAYNALSGVAAINADDVWTAGAYRNNGSSYQTLIVHWDGTAWNTVPSPNVGAGDNGLTSISAVSSEDVWAVGTSEGTLNRTLVEHWNGSAWSVVSSPNVGGGENDLQGVVALSPTNAWAAGYACPASCQNSSSSQTMILHWDGTSWNVVSSPNAGSGNNWLFGIAGTTDNDLWAVGAHNSCYGCVAQTMILHWNGAQWNIVNSPDSGSSTNELYGVSIVSDNDAWAVGYYYTPGDSRWRTLTLHWDGASWNLVGSPNAGQSSNFLQGVVAIAADDVWAVGRWGAASALTLHWDGTSWSVVASPTVNSVSGLNGISATSSVDVWAAGYTTASHLLTLTQHYSDPCAPPPPSPTPTEVCGLRWRLEGSQNPGSMVNALGSVKVIAPNDAWAVGSYNDSGADRTLIEHWDGSSWSTVPSPNLGSGDNNLKSVDALSANDAWAAGDYVDTTSGVRRTLVEHWDGSAWPNYF